MEKSGLWHILLIWVIWVIKASAQTTSQQAVPKISFYPCDIPTIYNFKFCCITENIHTATVDFFSGNANIVSVHHPCNVSSSSFPPYDVSCTIEGQKKTMVFDMSQYRSPSDPTTMGCRYYGKSAQYSFHLFQVLTENKGYNYVNNTQNATLFWSTSTQGYRIYNPVGEIIYDSQDLSLKDQPGYSFKVTSTHIFMTVLNVQKQSNGTYIYVTSGNRIKSGITLIVLDKLDKPTIHNETTDRLSGKAWAEMSCIAQQKSGAPPFYKPFYEVLWRFPSDASYTVTRNGSNVILDGIDCTSDKSQPIFCSVREIHGTFSDSQHFYPHILCSYKPTIPPPAAAEEESNGGLIAGIVILTLLCVLFMIVAYCGKDKVKRYCRYSCGRCKNSRFCVCRRCMKDDLDFDIGDDPPFNIATENGRYDNLDWRHILDLYSGENTPVVPPPRLSLPLRPDPLPSLPHLRGDNLDEESDSNQQLENDESGIDNPDFHDDEDTVTADDITVSDVSTMGATGVDHSTLVKEVETCLSHLKKLLSTTENQVQVRREHLVEDLMNIYTDPTILQAYLHINVLGEPGSDWGGVSRDIFTSFWNEAILLYFKGHDVHVPYLPPHKMEEERNFLLMGRILAHSTAVLGYIPISICKSCMMVTIFNTTHIEANTLLEDFLLFVDLKDRTLLQEALNDFSALTEEQRADLQNLFYQFDMGCILKEETFRDQLLNMARNELCLKPRSLCEKLRQGIPEVHFDQFWSQMTIDHIGILHARLKPTPEKVIKCLKLAEPIRLLEIRRRKVFQYFKDFIGALNDEDLQKFLQFVTGQNCVPKHNITVQFSNLSGAERRPVAHTCGYLIEIPETYDNYEDFEQEFRTLLQSDILRFDVQ